MFETETNDNDLADLTEDLAEAHWLLDRLADALSDVDRQGADLTRLMMRIDRGVALLMRSKEGVS